MTPDQRQAALRLADMLEVIDPGVTATEAAALLRELANEPVQEPVAHLYVGADYGGELQDWEIDAEQGMCDKLNEQYYGNPQKLPLYAHPQQQRKPLVDEIVRPLIDDTSEVFDANGPETPQVVRDVIEYVQSWLEVYFDKRGETP